MKRSRSRTTRTSRTRSIGRFAVNKHVEDIVRDVPPFPFLRESLEKLKPIADILVISATPNEALQRDMEEHDIAKYVAAICGKEAGTKKETLAVAAKYKPDHSLMIGGRPGDYSAAKANKTLFYQLTRAKRTRVGSDSSTKASANSSTARSPATTKLSCWPSSKSSFPPPRRGRSASQKTFTAEDAEEHRGEKKEVIFFSRFPLRTSAVKISDNNATSKDTVMSAATGLADFGLIGLAVMGENLLATSKAAVTAWR